MEEGDGCYRVDVSSYDGDVQIEVAAHRAATTMPDSVFASLDLASGFFRCAPVGYAATPKAGVFDGVAAGVIPYRAGDPHLR